MCRISIKPRLEAKLETETLSKAIQLYLICIIEMDIEPEWVWVSVTATLDDIPGDNEETERILPPRI